MSASQSASNAASPTEPSAASKRLAKKLGLRFVRVDELTIVRRRQGPGFGYVDRNGRRISNKLLTRRLDRLAVPPAYVEAHYCTDPRGHLQAVWRDAAGRLQYRYHAEWTKVREAGKLKRLAHLAKALPKIRKALTRHFATREPSREFALAAAVELVASSGIRAGRESYARLNGTRGAATLLKSNVRVKGQTIALSFRAKGGKALRKEISSPRLAGAIATLRKLSGPRLFQYRNGSGICTVRARDINAFLRELSGMDVSLKDLRTLAASNVALEKLSRADPAPSKSRRKKQIVEAMSAAAEELGNTPAICRKSYVPETLVTAFEEGRLQRRAKAGRAAGPKVLVELAAAQKV
jgi:DNA topoisomerase-1